MDGLRYDVAHHRIYLTRNDGTHLGQVALSGFPFRWWEESVSALLDTEDAGTACWLQQDGQWTDRERDFHEVSIRQNCDYRIDSGLLRRMALTRFTEGYGGTEVWSDPAGRDGWRGRLEMVRGPDDTGFYTSSATLYSACLSEWNHTTATAAPGGGCSATLRSITTPRQTLYIADLR